MDDAGLQEELDVDGYMDDLKVHGMGQTIEFCQKRQPGARYLCPYGCGKLVAMRTIDYHKNNGCGRKTESAFNNPDLKKRYYCCGVCYVEFVTRFEFHAHLRMEHDVHPDIHQLHFKDRTTFDRFVRWLEMEGGAHFRHKSGTKRRQRGKGIFMACNRSGYVNSNQIPMNRERTGPFRLGYSCTAYIHATEFADGRVSAEVCGDHYGHDARMRLPNIIKYIVAHKQLEGETNSEIIGYLRRHFLNFAHDNIYAQRICFVDHEELKSIFLSYTKKWDAAGMIPQKCEIWEEELLDRAGIVREGVPRLRDYNEKTTSDIAVEEQWPRPRVFVAKIRAEDGSLVPIDMTRADEGGETSLLSANGFIPDAEGNGVDDTRYDDIDVDEYTEEPYEERGIEDANDEYSNRIIRHDVRVEVETPSSSRLENVGAEKNKHEDLYEEEQIILENPNEDVVIVDDDIKMQMEQRNIPGTSHEDHMEQVGMIDCPSSRLTNSFLEEIEAFKLDLLKKSSTMNITNLRSLFIRFQTLHNSLMDKVLEDNKPITVFPNRNRLAYRPGKSLDKHEPAHAQYGRGDITLLPIADELSDDEALTEPCRHEMNYNANFWS
ncbi:unnamed protein product [Caenorhabditis bovis]|uniref:C2H2-type domain-containing protein n=1 Tax=Caenorhabditis bovis TaxID=2654633 RepID=A0A8S1EAG1_9PELO|nr:unnamed protein product [Caenorhabditis bovis]